MLREFQNIMLISNIPSVLEHGILSHARATTIEHSSIALQDVQDLREGKVVPGGRKLHAYANLYFHARNPMLSKRRNEAQNLCVLRISQNALQIPGAVIADQNAASKYVKFLAPSQLELLNLADIYADSWKHPDNQIREWQHSSAKCAELLIPNFLPPDLILGASVVNLEIEARLQAAGFHLPIEIDANLFFH